MTQTYLVTPVISDAAAFLPVLLRAIEATGAVSVLLRLAPGDERTAINLVKILAPPVQALGAAALVEDDPGLAARGGADGAHISGGLEAIRDALARLKPDRIVGAGGLLSRHDAMEAGEAGVDYVMFGEPEIGRDGREVEIPLAEVVEQAAWWAHLFETPCVAYAASREAADALAGTEAEFVALGPWAFSTG